MILCSVYSAFSLSSLSGIFRSGTRPSAAVPEYILQALKAIASSIDKCKPGILMCFDLSGYRMAPIGAHVRVTNCAIPSAITVWLFHTNQTQNYQPHVPNLTPPSHHSIKTHPSTNFLTNPKMSQYTPATLESLISITGEADHASILKHANNVLKSEKSHKRVLHTKAVALINLDRYDDAFSVLSVPELAGEAVLERAYCLYKLGRLEDALAAAVDGAGGGGRDERGLKHVEAQAVWVPQFHPWIFLQLTEEGCNV